MAVYLVDTCNAYRVTLGSADPGFEALGRLGCPGRVKRRSKAAAGRLRHDKAWVWVIWVINPGFQGTHGKKNNTWVYGPIVFRQELDRRLVSAFLFFHSPG